MLQGVLRGTSAGTGGSEETVPFKKKLVKLITLSSEKCEKKSKKKKFHFLLPQASNAAHEQRERSEHAIRGLPGRYARATQARYLRRDPAEPLLTNKRSSLARLNPGERSELLQLANNRTAFYNPS